MPLTLEELHDIRADCFADDIDIDHKRMAPWTSQQARDFFENGGVQSPSRASIVAALADCIPNAPIPDVSALDIEPNGASSSSEDMSKLATLPDRGSIYCVSDLHTDHPENMQWCKDVAQRGLFKKDALVIAGDVTPSMVLLEETLTTLVSAFAAVFFVVGNHDLWVKGRMNGGLHIRPKEINSIEKLDEVLALCARLGVRTHPGYACGAIICPIFSWYHQSWDTEPDIIGWDGLPQDPSKVLMDFHLCTWPASLSKADDSIARRFDALNDQRDGLPTSMLKRIEDLRAEFPGAPLITFSHFVPRLELNPEKRYLFFPPLARACGSVFLQARIDALRPAVHCFGHTHFGWGKSAPQHALADAAADIALSVSRSYAIADSVLDEVRYIQAPLAYPDERTTRLGTVATGPDFPHGLRPTPLLVFDAVTGTYPPRYAAGWSNFYARYPRRPDLNHLVAPYVGERYQRVPGVGEIGWLKGGDNPNSEPSGEPKPAWSLGPPNAVLVERRRRAKAKDPKR